MIHIYFGEGKGKTTAAVGLAVRASGAGLKVLFLQFLKDGRSPEIAQLKKLGVVCRGFWRWGFARQGKITAEQRRACAEGLKFAEQQSGNFNVVVLDEALTALELGLLSAEGLNLLMMHDGVEWVLTGRRVPATLMGMGDYVSEVVKHAHPHDKGVEAREGIEF